MINCEHDGPAVFRAKDPGEAILHTPVKGIASLEVRGRAFLGRFKIKLFRFPSIVKVGHSYAFLSYVDAALNP
jgi:hypothetical protein